jgi:hypothetical protein
MVLAVLSVMALSAHAAERITLRNGFSIDCDHHALVGGHVRLYLSPGEDNFIEQIPENIVSVEIVPDPPLEPKSVSGWEALYS